MRSGNADTENKLAALYDEGLGVAQDHVRARELFCEAAAQGYPPAMVNLGRMHVEATAGERDDVGGYALIRAAIDLGIPASMNDIAVRELGAASGRLDAGQLVRARALAGELWRRSAGRR